MNDSGLRPEETFSRARDEFLAGLSDQDRLLYSPCASPEDLLAAVEKLNIISQSRDRRHQHRAEGWIDIISKLSAALKPYLDAIDVFVSSNPQYAALVWGSLRLILQLASNYTEFFDKLTQLLYSLSESFPQYQRILGTALNMCPDGKSKELIKKYVAEVYVILLQIFHSAVRVFTKSDGRLKRTSIVIGQLMWKPFNIRFSDLIEKLERRHKTLFDELAIIGLANQFHERTNAEADRQVMTEDQKRNQEERNAAAAERERAQRERMLADAERRDNLEARIQMSSKIDTLLEKREYTEDEYRGKLLSAARKGIHPPNYADARVRASSIRLDGTATWVFDTPSFKSWVGDSSTFAQSSGTFGSNVMWITGKPGAGKTVLAASTIEYLEDSCPQNDILYFFFQSQSSENACSDAYRSILSQLLHKSGHDLNLLYKFSFAVPKPDDKQGDSDVPGLSNDGQEKFTSTVILELLRLCLRRGSILVLDGIDECRNIDVFLLSLWGLLETDPSTRVVLLSRINIPRLKRMVQSHCHLEFSEVSVSTDIGHFLTAEIHGFFEEAMLPGSIENTEALVQKLVRGADGMFLWARLMINLIRSPSMTPYQRLEVIERVSVPEGLEKLYERIFLYIASTGFRALTLASGCLAWLTKMVSPMSSFQLREALVIRGHLSSSATRDSIVDFEEAVIMTCAGLVIRAPASHPQSPTLTLVHVSIKEMVEELAMNHIWIDQYLNHGLHCIITDCSAARLNLASCCIHKILNFESRDYSTRPQEVERARELSIYASKNWLFYVEDAARKCPPLTVMHPHVKLAMSQAVSELLEVLSELFENPKALSNWLYVLYSAYWSHPPSTILSSLSDWINRVWAHDVILNETLLRKLAMFDEELGNIIKTWGVDLMARPHIVWDEMVSFANSKLFFNPGTTRVTNQFPRMPATRNNQQKLVTLVSKTSPNGMTKGVLSIWTSLPIRTGGYLSSLQRNPTLDLTELCSDWLIEYELWQLVPEPERISSISFPMDQRDVQLVLHRWLSTPFEDEMRIPLAICCDTQSFSVVHTVFSRVTEQHLTSHEWVSRSIPETLRPARSYQHWQRGAFCPYFSSVKLGLDGGYVALIEAICIGGVSCQEERISVYKFNASITPAPNIELVGSLDTSPGNHADEELLFHPFEEIIVVQVRREYCLWNFRQGSVTTVPVCEWPKKPMSFTSCGGYLVLTDTSNTNDCTVISLPSIKPPQSTLPSSDHKHNDLSLARPIATLSPWKASQPGDQSGSLVINNTQTLGRYNVHQQGTVSVSLRGSDVVLSDMKPSDSRDISVATLPNSLGIGQTQQCVRLPQSPREPIGISIDIEPRDTQSLSSSILAPMYVERDPRMVMIRNSGRMIEGPNSSTFDVLYGQAGRKRIMEDSGAEEMDGSKRRR